MCDCMKKVGDELQKRLMEKVPVGSEVSTNLFDKVGWDNQCFGLTSGKTHVMLKYRLAYRAKKTVNWRRTSHAWKLTSKCLIVRSAGRNRSNHYGNETDLGW